MSTKINFTKHPIYKFFKARIFGANVIEKVACKSIKNAKDEVSVNVFCQFYLFSKRIVVSDRATGRN